MTEVFDAVIVGGGPAGLQAAMMLMRVNRRIVLLDGGEGRNAPALQMHYFPTRDGTEPEEFRRVSLEQLSRYSNFSYKRMMVKSVSKREGYFHSQLESGGVLLSRRIVIATGVKDILPEIDRISEFYGKSVFHCPYCHGYEFKAKKIGLLGIHEMTFHMTGIISTLSNRLTVFTQASEELSDQLRKKLEAKQVEIVDTPIRAIEGNKGVMSAVTLQSGKSYSLDGLLISPKLVPHSSLADDLLCEKIADAQYQVDAEGRSSVAGVYISGDLVPIRPSALSASYHGMLVGATLHHDLVREDWCL